MAFSRDLRFRSHANRQQETFYAAVDPLPSPVHFQHVHTKGIIERSPLVCPNKDSLSGTTFGCSTRPVLLEPNFTCQGKISGAFKVLLSALVNITS